MAVIVKRVVAMVLDPPTEPKGGGFARGNAGRSRGLLPGEPSVHAGDQPCFGGVPLLPPKLG